MPTLCLSNTKSLGLHFLKPKMKVKMPSLPSDCKVDKIRGTLLAVVRKVHSRHLINAGCGPHNHGHAGRDYL